MSVVGDICVRNISKSFNNNGKKIEVLKDVNFEIHKNEFLVLFGPGQCGKSVLMEIIANISEPDSGEIMCDGKKTQRRRSLHGFPALCTFSLENLSEECRNAYEIQRNFKRKT